MFPAFTFFFLEIELDQLEQMLRWHDWYYERSDDPRVYARGCDQWQAIAEQIAVVNNLFPGMGDAMLACAKP